MNKNAKFNSDDAQFEEGKKYYYVGVAGFSANKDYDVNKAMRYISDDLLRIREECRRYGVICVLVSGLTNIGIPGMAYDFASKMGYYTIGVACEKAHEYPCFPVDKEVIYGAEWGEESPVFLNTINVLFAYGGGKQTEAELTEAQNREIPTVVRDIKKSEEEFEPEALADPRRMFKSLLKDIKYVKPDPGAYDGFQHEELYQRIPSTLPDPGNMPEVVDVLKSTGG